MVTYNTITIDNQNFIQQKAKTKADGVYTIRGILYRVENGRATHFASEGNVLLFCGAFNMIVDQYDYTRGDHRAVARKLLKSIKGD